MKNLYLTPADFWKERDFGTKITAMFEFIGAHWRPLGKCLVYFVLPLTLLAGIGLGVFYNGIYNQLGSNLAARQAHLPVANASPFGSLNVVGIGVAAVSFLLSIVLLVSTVYGYLRARLRLPATAVATPALVWAAIRERVGRMLLAWLLLLLAYGGLVALLVALAALLIGRGSGGGTAVVVLLFVALLPALAYLGVVLSLYFPVLWLEEVSVLDAVGRSFQLIRGHWWATAGLLVVASLLQSVLGIVFAIPQYAVMFGKVLHVPFLGSDVLGVATQALYVTGVLFTYPVSLLAISFQYFNLAEQREGRGLRLLMDGLGQAAPEAFAHQYRPEEEHY